MQTTMWVPKNSPLGAAFLSGQHGMQWRIKEAKQPKEEPQTPMLPLPLLELWEPCD